MQSINFFGASGTVTGSCYQVNHDHKALFLVDFGMYQGTKDIEKLNHVFQPIGARELQAAFLTHAHLDHCGRIPVLFQQGYKGKLFMTEPTLELMQIVLHDSARIAAEDETVLPLYSESDVEALLPHIEIVNYDEPISVNGYEIIYRDAGHIIGSASIEIVDRRKRGGASKVIFSGDIGNYPHTMLCNPYEFQDADCVVMESTYGGRNHPKQDVLSLIEDECSAIGTSGGTLLIPAFAIERTQEVLYAIKRLKDDGRVKKDLPVFLDSPMAIKATDVYVRNTKLYNNAFKEACEHMHPFMFPGLHILERQKQGRAIDVVQGPKIIIAGSGMMTGGRIQKHAITYLPTSSTRILFVGYQGEDTPGKVIKEGASVVKLRNIDVPIRAHVSSIDALSAHADEPRLLEWLGNIHGTEQVFLTHGEDTARDALDLSIHAAGHDVAIHKPALGDEVLLVNKGE